MQHSPSKVHVSPFESDGLTEAHPGAGQREQKRIALGVVRLSCLEQLDEFPGGKYLYLSRGVSPG